MSSRWKLSRSGANHCPGLSIKNDRVVSVKSLKCCQFYRMHDKPGFFLAVRQVVPSQILVLMAHEGSLLEGIMATFSMAQRNLFPTPQMPTMDHDQIWNHPSHPDPHPHLGATNGSYMLPLDGSGSIAVSRPNDYRSSTFTNNMVPNSGPLRDPYFHLSSTASSSRFPPSFTQHGSSLVHHQTEIGRSAYKRKSPVIPLAYGEGNTSGCYNAGSSSSLHMSSNPLHPKPMVMPQYRPLDPASIIRVYGSDNLLSAGDDSHRNVRSRHVQTNPAVAYSSGNPPLHFHAAGSVPGLNMEGQLSHLPILPMAPQGDPRLNFEANQYVGGPTIINSTVEANGGLHPNLTQSRNAISLSTHRDPSTRRVGASSNGHYQRSNSYRSGSSNNSMGFATASLDVGGPSALESVASSRYSRPLPITGRSSYRNGRIRGSNSRFHLGYAEDGTGSRWSSEGAVLMDQSTYYDSRTWFDQHRDMRLDIDNMSYEELLALGERIGKVSTGLSEEAMSGCLKETTHCSSNKVEDDDDEVNCVICLEGYKDQDKLGRLNCRHDFHASCIKNWLRIKNACPICKAAASNDTSKEEQSVSR